MNDEQTVKVRFETAGGGLVEIDAPAEHVEALDRGESVDTRRWSTPRHFTGAEAQERVRAWLDGFRHGS